MAKDIQKMKRERAAVVEEMRALLTAAEARSDKKLTGDEETKYNELRAKVDAMNSDIEREEHLQKQEADQLRDKPMTNEDHRNLGEFLVEARFNPSRLESRDVTMGNGPSMGLVVPEQFSNQIRMIEPHQAIFRPRATVLPAGDPPDAAINLVALDQSNALGVYSGVTVQWTAENGARQDAGDPRVRGIKIEPQEVSAYIDLSDKLLRNSAVAGAMCENLLRKAIVAAEEVAFCSGDGVGKPLGIIGHSSTVRVARTNANGIVYADIINMYSRTMGGNLAWVASRTCLPRLMTMVDAGNNLIWQPNAREKEPATLLGLPILLNPRSPVLGSEGDLMLVDLSYYAIKDGSGLAIFMDPYTQKVNGVTRMYIFWNVDGQPMMTTPLLEEDGVTTVSPFVVLR